MEVAYIIMLGLMIAGYIGVIFLGRAADASEARLEALLKAHPELRDDPEIFGYRATRR
jgi:hypothetical protein